MSTRRFPGRKLFQRVNEDCNASIGRSLENLNVVNINRFREKYNFDLVCMQPSVSENGIRNSSNLQKTAWSWECLEYLESSDQCVVPEFYRTSRASLRHMKKTHKPRDTSDSDLSSSRCSSVENHTPNLKEDSEPILDLTLMPATPIKSVQPKLTIVNIWQARIRRSSCSFKDYKNTNNDRKRGQSLSIDKDKKVSTKLNEKSHNVSVNDTPFTSPMKSRLQKQLTQLHMTGTDFDSVDTNDLSSPKLSHSTNL